MMVMNWNKDRYGKLEANWGRDYREMALYDAYRNQNAKNVMRPVYTDELGLLCLRAKQLSALFREVLLEGEDSDVPPHRRMQWQ